MMKHTDKQSELQAKKSEFLILFHEYKELETSGKEATENYERLVSSQEATRCEVSQALQKAQDSIGEIKEFMTQGEDLETVFRQDLPLAIVQINSDITGNLETRRITQQTLQQQYRVHGSWTDLVLDQKCIDTYTKDHKTEDFFEFYKTTEATQFERYVFYFQSYLQPLFNLIGLRTREQLIRDLKPKNENTEAASQLTPTQETFNTLMTLLDENRLLRQKKINYEGIQKWKNKHRNKDPFEDRRSLEGEKRQLDSNITTALSTSESLATEKEKKRQELLSFMQNNMTITETIWKPKPPSLLDYLGTLFSSLKPNELQKAKKALITAITDNARNLIAQNSDETSSAFIERAKAKAKEYIKSINDNTPTSAIDGDGIPTTIKDAYKTYIDLKNTNATQEESTVYNTPENVLYMLIQQDNPTLSGFTKQIEASIQQRQKEMLLPSTQGSQSSRQRAPKTPRLQQRLTNAVQNTQAAEPDAFDAFASKFTQTCALIFNNKDPVKPELVTEFQNICHALTPEHTTIGKIVETRRTAQKQQELLQLCARKTTDSSTLERHGFGINAEKVLDPFNNNVQAKYTDQGLLLPKLNDDGSWKMETVSGDQEELLPEEDRQTMFNFANAQLKKNEDDILKGQEKFTELWSKHGDVLCNAAGLTQEGLPRLNYQDFSTSSDNYNRITWKKLMSSLHPDRKIQKASPKQAFLSATDPSIQAQCEKVFEAQDTLLKQVAGSLYQTPASVESINSIHKTLQAGVCDHKQSISP